MQLDTNTTCGNRAILSRTSNLAAEFISRAGTLKLKGKRRDDEAVSWFLGATSLAYGIDEQHLARHLETVTALIVCTRGFAGVEFLANAPKIAEAALEVSEALAG